MLVIFYLRLCLCSSYGVRDERKQTIDEGGGWAYRRAGKGRKGIRRQRKGACHCHQSIGKGPQGHEGKAPCAGCGISQKRGFIVIVSRQPISEPSPAAFSSAGPSAASPCGVPAAVPFSISAPLSEWPALLTYAQAAAALQVTRAAVVKRIQRGTLRARGARIRRDEILI